MMLTVSVNHPDIAKRPVDIRVWRNAQEVLATTLRTHDPIIEYVPLPSGQPRVVLETWVNRVVRPADFGVGDTRELGLMVRWAFVDAPTPRTLRSGGDRQTARR
jgi:hypothetical protein